MKKLFWVLFLFGFSLCLATGAGPNVVKDAKMTGAADFSALTNKSTVRVDLGVAPALGSFNVADYGARPDGVVLYDGIFTGGSTTFTSASAHFTSDDVGKTIVLQISQTVRQILTIAARANSTSITLSAPAAGPSSAYTDRITTYGTDNTGAINAALTAMGTNGGELRLHDGIYLCTGAPSGAGNSIFHIPYVADYTDAAPAITIVGVNSPALAFSSPGQKPFTTGTIIYCPNQSVSGTAPAIFAGPPIDQTGYYWPGCVGTTFRISNVTVRQVPNPKMHAFQMANIGSFFPDYVACDLDVPYSHSGNLLANPSGGGATAFLFPRKWCGFYQRAGTILAFGYNVGAELNDTLFLDKLVAEMCYSGITATDSTNFFQATHLGLYRCRTAIDGGAGPIKIVIGLANIETNRGGTDWIPTWTINNNGKFDIDNYAGAITGRMTVCTVLSNFGPIQTSVRSHLGGGADAGLKVYDLVTSQHLGKETFNNIELKSEQTGLVAPVVNNNNAGSTSYTYQLGYWMIDGSLQLGPPTVSTTGNASLGGSNFNRVNILAVPGAVAVGVYRIASAGSPSTVGKIGQLYIGSSGEILDDNGLAADGILPTQTTGKLTAEQGEFSGSLVVAGAVVASSFSGDGSGLTGVGSSFSDSAGLRGLLSDENGTGVAIFNSATDPVFLRPDASSSTVIARGIYNNKLAASTSQTVTFSGTQTTGQSEGLLVTNTGSTAWTLTLPSGNFYSEARGQTVGGTAITTMSIPVGTYTITIDEKGSNNYRLYGEPLNNNSLTTATAAPGDSVSGYDTSAGTDAKFAINGPIVTTGDTGTVTNAMLAGSIGYSKLSITGAILNADLAGSIAYSKLSLTGAILNADLAGSIADSKLSTISTAGKVSDSALSANIPLLTAANTFTAGAKQTFTSNGTNAGIAIGGVSSDPSSINTGDLYFRSDLGQLKLGAAPATIVSIVDTASTQTLSGKTFVAPVLGTPSSGNGSNLSNLNATNLASGTVADARLSANVPLLNASNAFTAAQGITTANALAQTNTVTGLGTTVLPGLLVTNTTAAAAGAQQCSPSIRWTGQGWKTAATAASQPVDFRAYVKPVQSTTAPTVQWVLESSVNGGAFGNGLIVDSVSGALSTTAGDISSGGKLVSGTGLLQFGAITKMRSTVDGTILFQDSTNTTFGLLQFGTATSGSPALKLSGATLQAKLADDSAYTTFSALTFLPAGTATTCTGATIGAGSKSNAGFVTATTTGTSTIVVTFPVTAPTGWNISASDSTAITNMVQTASTTTTATLSGTTVSGDVIRYIAMPY